jgi:hypothetical protein
MLLSFVLLAQAAVPTAVPDPTAHLRYQRSVQLPMLPPGGSRVCAVLDAAAFAHAASGSGDDLRLYRGAAGETPFTLLESEAAPEDAATAAVQNVAVQGRTLSFDLAMPHRAYTMVRLHLDARDFLAQAAVSGAAVPGVPRTRLGSYTLFDLSGEHLARSTDLPLQESRLPRLHVALRLWRPDGTPVEHPSTAIVQGADVPPSREAQTLYTTVAATTEIAAAGQDPHGYSLATLRIPAHLPVERVRFVVDPAFAGSFVRQVSIGATPVSAPAAAPATVPQEATGAAESVQGTIARVERPAPSAGAPAVHYAALAVDDTLGSNLRGPALVRVAVQKLDGRPLPLRAVELQMRQRSFCFQAVAGAPYTLRYGDAGLPAPVYASEGKASEGKADEGQANAGNGVDSLGKDMDSDEEDARAGDAGGLEDDGPPSAGPAAASKPLLAVLGPEQENPAFVAEPRRAAPRQTHPEMFWVGMLGLVTLLGAIAGHRVRYEREGDSRGGSA